MFLGSRVINDGADFANFVAVELGAPEVAARVAASALEIEQRCTAGPFTDQLSAKRWAHTLVGGITTDAVMLAVLEGDSGRELDHARCWARQQFDNAIAAARAASGNGAVNLSSLDLDTLGDHYEHAVGDIEQQLASEDHNVDGLLRQAPSVKPPAGLTRQPPSAPPSVKVSAGAPSKPTPIAKSAAGIEKFIIDWMAHELKIAASSIEPTRSFFDYGIDSVMTVMLAVSLEEWLGCELYPELVYHFPIIRNFVERVAEQHTTG